MESLPQSMKEAFYLKVPVVATSVGDIPDMVKNNETGLLIPPNEPQSLINAINSSLEQKEDSARMASNAYDLITKNYP